MDEKFIQFIMLETQEPHSGAIAPGVPATRVFRLGGDTGGTAPLLSSLSITQRP
jgi:hypothetical protein